MLTQLKRLARHSAIYGLGGIVSRLLAVLLIPLYTRYLGTGDYGKIETLVAGSVVLVIVLRMGISMAFFRFYFDAEDDRGRTTVVRTSFWFTMASATAGLVAGSCSRRRSRARSSATPARPISSAPRSWGSGRR